jgi:hypothetical protein
VGDELDHGATARAVATSCSRQRASANRRSAVRSSAAPLASQG